MPGLSGKKILLVITGGIAAYKALELIRLLGKLGADVHCILSNGGSRFVTPLSVSALSGNPVHTDMWALSNDSKISHVQLRNESDLVVVAPASADIIGKWALGLADDLASLTLMASDKPAIFAPTMNPVMWNSPQVQENTARLERRGFIRIGPDEGEAACGETGQGRMAEPETILGEIERFFLPGPLEGRRAIVTSGPTFEAIDPVRFICNRSSGKQGHAIAASLRQAGADVTLISGPVALQPPPGVKVINVESAREMHDAAVNALPADIAVCAAAVADWRPESCANSKIKKNGNAEPPAISLCENPDILSSLSSHGKRPALVIGFAAETGNLLESAKNKRKRKKCDWIIANEVGGEEPVFGSENNHVYFITDTCTEEWPPASKNSIADRLTRKISDFMDGNGHCKK